MGPKVHSELLPWLPNVQKKLLLLGLAVIHSRAGLPGSGLMLLMPG